MDLALGVFSVEWGVLASPKRTTPPPNRESFSLGFSHGDAT
jgi:hypothetical protein